jgi:hypothetical protein
MNYPFINNMKSHDYESEIRDQKSLIQFIFCLFISCIIFSFVLSILRLVVVALES